MKIEERLERVRSILEKNNMLEGLQVFSDKQLDEAEEKFNFTFPEELRWVLKIIGVGGNNPLDEYHICNPHEPFNGLYFRRCDYLDFTRGEDLNGGFLFQINTGSYGPFYVMVLNGDLRGCIFDYNEELNRTQRLADDKDIICLLERWCECLENGWIFHHDLNYAGDAETLIARFKKADSMDEQCGVLASLYKFRTDPVQTAITAKFLRELYESDYDERLRFDALKELAWLDWKYQFPDIDVQALILRSENKAFPDYLARFTDSFGKFCPPEKRAAYYPDLLELVRFYFPRKYPKYCSHIPYLKELLDNPAFQIKDVEQFFYSQRNTRTFFLYDFSKFYKFFHALTERHPHEPYILDLLLLRMKYLKEKDAYLELLETASYSHLYIEKNPQTKKKLLPHIKEAVRLAEYAMEMNEFTESEQKSFQHSMIFIDKLFSKK